MRSVKIDKPLSKRQLVDARALLEKHWTQGTYGVSGHPEMGLCVAGACGYVASGGEGTYVPNTAVVARQLGIPADHGDVEYGYHVASVEDWNDVTGRTKDEVLALFDKVIAATEGD